MLRAAQSLLIVFLIGFSASAMAQNLPPLPGEPKPFTLAAPTTIELENGLKITFVEFGIVPKVSINVVVNAGNINEGDQTWLADITAEMMKQGTTTKSALDLVVAAADMGGGVGFRVGPDQMILATDVLSEYAPEALELLADILRNPSFPEADLPRIKANFLRNLSIAKTDPRSLGNEAFLRLMFGDHPYGTAFPTVEQIEGYTIGDVRGFYDANLGAGRTHIYIVGQFDQRALTRAIRQAFGSWQAGPVPLDLPATPLKSLRVQLIDRPASQQSTVYLGLPVSDVADGDYIPMLVMHTLLGGSFSSRITQNIREDKGYTYSPRASIRHRKGVAYWFELADINTSQTGLALEEIFQEIRTLQENVPPAWEVDKVQNYRAGVFVLQNGSRSGIIAQLAFLNLQGLDVGFLNSYVDAVFEVPDQAVSDMARIHLPLDQMTLVVVGDMALVEEQIRSLPELQGAEFIE